ncbi:hypothetical protein BsWGS_23424 [Bradybaena similaris]
MSVLVRGLQQRDTHLIWKDHTMPFKHAEKARKTKKANSKESRDTTSEIVTRNLRSLGLRDREHSTSKVWDATEVSTIQHVEDLGTDPAVCTLKIDKTNTQLPDTLHMCNEDSESSSVVLSGNIKPPLSCTDLARKPYNGELVMECTQQLEGVDIVFENECVENKSADVSDNITGNRDESNVKDADEMSNNDLLKQSDKCLQLQHDHVYQASSQHECASGENISLSRTVDSNAINTAAVSQEVIHNNEIVIDEILPSTCAFSTFNKLKSFPMSAILHSKCDKPMLQDNTTTESIEDITTDFLSQNKQTSLDVFRGSLETDATQALPTSRLLKRKIDEHLFSTQPQLKKLKPPSMNIPDHCFNTTDSAHYQNESLGINDNGHIREGLCESEVVVDTEDVQRNMDSEDMLSYSTATIQDTSCAGYIIEEGENGIAVTKDVDSCEITEERRDHLAATQCWYPVYAKENEELCLSHLQDHNRAHEEQCLPHFQDYAKVHEELIVQHPPDQTVSLLTKSDISEQAHAVGLKDSVKDVASGSKVRNEVQQNLVEAADREENQTSYPLQITHSGKYDDLDKDTAENITDLSKPANTALSNIGHKKLHQNSVSSEEQFTVESSESQPALAFIKDSITESTKYTTDMLDHPAETVLTDVPVSTYVNIPFHGITANMGNSVLKLIDKETVTFATAQNFVMNASQGNNMKSIQHHETEDLVCTSTQEFTIHDLVVNDLIKKERVQNVQLTYNSTMTVSTKESNLSKEKSINKSTVNMDCKIDPPLSSSCSNVKEGNNSETCEKQICYGSGHFNMEDTFNDNKCADINKLTNSDAVETQGDMLDLEATEMSRYAAPVQTEGSLSNENVGGKVIAGSSLHTDIMPAYSVKVEYDNTKCHLLSPHAQTVCGTSQQKPQSFHQLVQDGTCLKSGSLIAENFTNQICSQQPPASINMYDSINECSTASQGISAPLLSPHKTSIREVQLNGYSNFNDKCSMKSPEADKNTNQTNEDSQLGKSDCFGRTSKCADDFQCKPVNITITGADKNIPEQNEMSLDNNYCHTIMRSINGSCDSDTSTNKSCLTSRKPNLNVVTSEQRSTCFPSTSEKCILENYQQLSDNLDCYSLSDVKETTGMQLNPAFNNHKEESKRIAAPSLSNDKGTSSSSSNFPHSVPQGMFCTPQRNPGSNYQGTTSAFPNNSGSGINGLQETLQKLSAQDSTIYLSDSQICQLASEDFEQSFNTDETENKHNVQDVHPDKFEHSFQAAQTRSLQEIEQRKAEGKKLVDAIIADLVSVNKQLLRMKREMEIAKRIVQQQHNQQRHSFHGKKEFGFHYQN